MTSAQDGQTKREIDRVQELEAALARSEQRVADLLAEIDVARANSHDSEQQLRVAALNATDAERQIVNAREQRLRLLEEVEAWRNRVPKPGFWARVFGKARSASPLPPHVQKCRRKVSFRLLNGKGVEIGALHSPLPVPKGTRVTYVDRVSVTELRGEYPELGESDFVQVDVVDDGEELARFDPESLDFIIACHMLEHCENPLGTIRNHLEKLRGGALLYYVIPDKRSCFDADRPLTSFEHLVRDDREGPEWSRWDHYVEFARFASKTPSAQAEQVAQQMMTAGSSIHFHVWDDQAFREFVESANNYLGAAYSIEHFQLNHSEIIAVLRKQ